MKTTNSFDLNAADALMEVFGMTRVVKPIDNANQPEIIEGDILVPANNSFDAINKFVHNVREPIYEELAWALLGLAASRENELAKLTKKKVKLNGNRRK